MATTNGDYPSGIYREPGWGTLADSAVPVYYGSVQFAPLKVSAGIAGYLREAIPDFDIVHLHGLHRFPTTIAGYLSRHYGVPYVIRPFGSLNPHLYNQSTTGQHRLKRLHHRWFDVPNLQAASAVHYGSADERERASFLGLQSPSFIVPNGMEWTRFATLPERGELRARLGIGDAPVVLFVGRIHATKGLDLLIPAFDAVRRVEPDAQLVIAGPTNDSHAQEVLSWIADRGLDSAVHVVGQLDGPDVLRAYVDADVFALPSYAESFGMAVVEAMACALPVVVSDQVGIHNEVSSAAAGVTTRCDVDDVATALSALLRDPDRRQAMGRAGRQLVQDRYSWPAIVDALTEEYGDLIERGRPKGNKFRGFRNPQSGRI